MDDHQSSGQLFNYIIKGTINTIDIRYTPSDIFIILRIGFYRRNRDEDRDKTLYMYVVHADMDVYIYIE